MTDPGTCCQAQDYYGTGNVAIKGISRPCRRRGNPLPGTDGGDSWSLDFTRVDTCT